MKKLIVVSVIFLSVACTQKKSAKIEYVEPNLVPVKEQAASRRIENPDSYGLVDYKVEQDEDILAISQKFNLDIYTIVEMNYLKPPYRVRPGQVLYVPKYEGFASRKTQVARIEPPKAVVSKPVIEKKAPVIVVEKKPLAKITESKITETKPIDLNLDKNLKKQQEEKLVKVDRFIWPVNGEIISGFGPQKGGINNNAVTLKAKDGEKVKSAAAGKVIYIGENIKGYGNMIIIKHAPDWTTAYAYNKKILIKKGDVVKKGQEIAIAGPTEGNSGSEVFFALRKDNEPVNPVQYVAN